MTKKSDYELIEQAVRAYWNTKESDRLMAIVPQWIPVSERLPQDNDYKPFSYYEDGAVLYCTKIGKIGFGWYYESTRQWANEDDCDPGEVIAWMPLPAPYKGGEEESGCDSVSI